VERLGGGVRFAMSRISKAASSTGLWIRGNGFLLALGVAVMAAFAFPDGGARGGVLNPEWINNGGIALILFLQGLSLAFEKIREGAGNWRLHLIIQAFTFGVFPIVGLVMDQIVPFFWSGQPQAIRDGFLFLCVLPSTVSTSVVLTAVARGNTPGALFNAALSNIAGVILTPLLVHLLMTGTGQASTGFGPLLMKITLLTLLPFALGMMMRPLVKNRVDANKKWITRISNAVIVFIVYSAFCDSVKERVWEKYGALQTGATGLVVVLLFAGISLLVYGVCRMAKLNREDAIAAYFCSVKKTLAMGVPLAALIFGTGGDLSLILLPIMLYHPLQLFVNGVLANRWGK
jgi:solute carrier family 10 (sodium/bile acid cotransporter), member 7